MFRQQPELYFRKENKNDWRYCFYDALYAACFFMTPGLALFYGGMVRRKNVLNTMMLCLSMLGIGVVMWGALGYSLSFGEDIAGIIGGVDKLFFQNVSMGMDGNEIPEIVSAIFNMMFAIIAPAIIMGSLAERVRFSKMLVFCAFWSLLVYYPLSHLTSAPVCYLAISKIKKSWWDMMMLWMLLDVTVQEASGDV